MKNIRREADGRGCTAMLQYSINAALGLHHVQTVTEYKL